MISRQNDDFAKNQTVMTLNFQLLAFKSWNICAGETFFMYW
jgi:hypothetical protein